MSNTKQSSEPPASRQRLTGVEKPFKGTIRSAVPRTSVPFNSHPKTLARSMTTILNYLTRDRVLLLELAMIRLVAGNFSPCRDASWVAQTMQSPIGMSSFVGWRTFQPPFTHFPHAYCIGISSVVLEIGWARSGVRRNSVDSVQKNGC